MKKVLVLVAFVALNKSMRSQCIFIYPSEKIKGVEIPIERTEFDIYVNDTLKKHATSFNDGSLGRVSLEPGKYTIKIKNPEYQDGIKTDVIVNESKTTNVVIDLYKVGVKIPEEKK